MNEEDRAEVKKMIDKAVKEAVDNSILNLRKEIVNAKRAVYEEIKKYIEYQKK